MQVLIILGVFWLAIQLIKIVRDELNKPADQQKDWLNIVLALGGLLLAVLVCLGVITQLRCLTR